MERLSICLNIMGGLTRVPKPELGRELLQPDLYVTQKSNQAQHYSLLTPSSDLNVQLLFQYAIRVEVRVAANHFYMYTTRISVSH
jgi:hypothetical protein